MVEAEETCNNLKSDEHPEIEEIEKRFEVRIFMAMLRFVFNKNHIFKLVILNHLINFIDVY